MVPSQAVAEHKALPGPNQSKSSRNNLKATWMTLEAFAIKDYSDMDAPAEFIASEAATLLTWSCEIL